MPGLTTARVGRPPGGILEDPTDLEPGLFVQDRGDQWLPGSINAACDHAAHPAQPGHAGVGDDLDPGVVLPAVAVARQDAPGCPVADDRAHRIAGHDAIGCRPKICGLLWLDL